ncbi:MAG TPA: hypothetical protein PL169_12710, partial [Leptospiraceae bacterium]|nr:hypothetical protein [Leptospiraceae bacterium]
VIEKIKARNIPYLIFLNKSDRSMEYEKVLSDVGSLLGRPAVPMFYRADDGTVRYSFLEKEVNEDIELSLIEWDEKLTAKYFSLKDKKKIILQGMSSGFRQNAFVPAFIGSALNGHGVREFLDFLCIVSKDADHPDTGEFIAFKRQNNSHLGQIVYFKSGSRLKPKQTVYRNSEPYTVQEILQIVPGGFQSVQEVFPGSIFVLQDSSFFVGEKLFSEHLESSETEETLIQKDFSILLEPDSDTSRENLEKGIRKLVWEDQGLSCRVKEDTGQLELFGIGELHLEIAVSRLKEIVQENFSIKSINVAKYGLYKNMVKKLCFEHSTFDGKWKSGKVHGFLEARTDLQSYVEFDIPLEGILKDSITSAFSEFTSHGWEGLPVLGMNLRVVGYEAPELIEEHTPSLIKIAVISGLKSVLPGTVICIGPLSFFEIQVPQNYTGNVISLLNKRHAKVTSLEVADDLKSVLKGEASAEQLLGFTAALRNMTQGKGFVTLNTFFKYDKFSRIAETTD